MSFKCNKYHYDKCSHMIIHREQISPIICLPAIKGCRMGRSQADKGSLWYMALLINTRFRFFILE